MPDELSIEDVRKVAKLARLAVSDADAERYRAELAAVLGYVERLGEVDVAGVEPMAHVADSINVLRDDEPRIAYDPAVVEKLAPDAEGGFIRVPRVLGEGGGA